MYKSLVIFIVCLVTICCVWGLNDRLDYDGFKMAAEHVQGGVDVLVDDLNALASLGFVVENFNPQEGGKAWTEGKSLFLLFGGETAEFTFTNAENAERIKVILAPLTVKLPWGNVVTDTINGFFGVLLSFVLFLLVIVFDVVGVVWTVIEAFLHLLGIGTIKKPLGDNLPIRPRPNTVN